MWAFVRLRLPDDSLVELGHGDLIGRLPSVALHLDDARVSEAHAMVSLRGRALRLLALRGRFALDARPLSELTLRRGQRIELAQDLHVRVEEVVLPTHVLALVGPGLPQQVLNGTASLVLRPRPSLIPRYVGDADAWFWTAESWRVRVAGGPAGPLEVGPLPILGERFEVVEVALESSAQSRTQALGGVAAPFRLVSTYDTAHFHRESRPTLTLTGIGARIIGELVACGAPVGWTEVARIIWPRVGDANQLRRLWDISLARTRRKLRDAGLRPGVLHSDGRGNIELILGPLDQLEDRT